jgi:hypothetical protein
MSKLFYAGDLVDWTPKMARRGLSGLPAAKETWTCTVLSGPWEKDGNPIYTIKSKKYHTTHTVVATDLILVRRG